MVNTNSNCFFQFKCPCLVVKYLGLDCQEQIIRRACHTWVELCRKFRWFIYHLNGSAVLNVAMILTIEPLWLSQKNFHGQHIAFRIYGYCKYLRCSCILLCAGPIKLFFRFQPDKTLCFRVLNIHLGTIKRMAAVSTLGLFRILLHAVKLVTMIF